MCFEVPDGYIPQEWINEWVNRGSGVDRESDRNSASNYFLGFPMHSIAGREYRIAASKIIPDTGNPYSYRKVHVIEIPARAPRETVVFLELVPHPIIGINGVKKIYKKEWIGNLTETEKRDLQCIMKN